MRKSFRRGMDDVRTERRAEPDGQKFATEVARPSGEGSGIKTPDALFSDAELQELAWLLEEEKLAGDLYATFYAQTGATIFRNIARSEDRHFDALLRQAEKAGLETDDIVFRSDGDFVNDDLQALYDGLLVQGSASKRAALEVGVVIETTDIADLAAAAEAVAGTPLADVYVRLLDGSTSHLEAFEAALGL